MCEAERCASYHSYFSCVLLAYGDRVPTTLRLRPAFCAAYPLSSLVAGGTLNAGLNVYGLDGT